MLVVSKEKITEKNKSYWKLVCEDGSEYTVSDDDYYSKAIYSEDRFLREFLEELEQSYMVRKAKSIALRLVMFKLYTTEEIKKKLEVKDFSDDVVEIVIESLKEQGYLDDRAYAFKFVNQKLRLKPVSRQRLSFELQHKGIDNDIIAEALDEIDPDDEANAKKIFDKRFSKQDLSDPKQYRKAVNYLVNRGFSVSLIKRIIDDDLRHM